MAGPRVILYPVPSGGAVLLDLPDYLQPAATVTTTSIGIATSGAAGLSPFTTVYTGPPVPKYLDVGDALPGPLDPTTAYVYQVTDVTGTTQAGPVTPSWALKTQPDQLSQIMIRLLQGAIDAMPLPDGVPRPIVSTEMPQNGNLAMPFIVLNLDLLQQSETQIGEDFPNPTQDNDWTLFAQAKRVWRVTVMCKLAEERDFFRDILLATFRAMKVTAFTPLGYNVRHSFQAASYTDVKDWEGLAPGFYGADLMLEIDGVFPVAILTNYLPITRILTTATTEEAVIQAETKPEIIA